MSDDTLAYASIDSLAPRLKSGELSPVELARSALERIEDLEPALNAFLRVFTDDALEAARQAETEIAAGRWRGPLHGVPIGLKDLVDVAGTATTGGSPILWNNIARHDATIVTRFKEAGAIILGKLGLVEFAMGATGLNPHNGNTHNPWNLERITAGSSTGSAASVAAGICVGAIGSDTGGSIRMPASLCGIAGLKPTYGRVSRAGVLDLSWSCDHVGPMARRSSDCAYIMNAIGGHDPRDPASATQPVPDFTAGIGRGLDGLRIGVPDTYFFDDVDPEIESAVRSGIELMGRNGATVREVPTPWAAKGRAINMGLMMPEAVSVHERWLKDHPDQYTPEVRSRLMSFITVPALEYVRAQRARRWLCEQVSEAMREVDLLVTPTVPVQTPTIEACTPPPGQNEGREGARLAIFTGVFNATGQPSLSVPCGFTQDNMPIGMMITGRWFDEVTVLQAGDAFETLAGLHDRHPPV